MTILDKDYSINLRSLNLFFYTLCILSFIFFCLINLNSELTFNIKNKGPFYQPYRYYDPKLCRFTQPDTIVPTLEFIDLNRFAYTRNNPIKYNDPTGHIPSDVLENAKALYGDLVDSGMGFVLAADQAAYTIVGTLADLVTPPENDPLGLLVFVGTMGAGSGAADDIAFKGPFRQPSFARRVNPEHLAAAENAAIARRQAIAEGNTIKKAALEDIESAKHLPRLQAAERAAIAKTPRSEDHAAYQRMVEHNTRRALNHELNEIAQEARYAQKLDDQMELLADQLSYLLGEQLRSPRPLGTFELGTTLLHPAVEAIREGWAIGGNGFTTDRTFSPRRFDRDKRRASAETRFSYSDREGNVLFELRLRETYTGLHFDALRQQLHTNGPPSTPGDARVYGD